MMDSEAVWPRLLWRPGEFLADCSDTQRVNQTFRVFLIESRVISDFPYVRSKRVKIHTKKNSNLHTTLYQWTDLLLLTFHPDHQMVKQLCLLFRLLLCAKGTHTLPGITVVHTPNKHTFVVLTHCRLFWPLMQNKPFQSLFYLCHRPLYNQLLMSDQLQMFDQQL